MRASDMPETEGAEIQRFKWATSAAHVAGRRLVSAEAATWLGEHFRVRLAEVKAAVDQFFVAGVNHIVYHGTAYSPVGDAWPGWQFYASVEFNPQNAWWDDFAALNTYVARVQSFLQAGRPDTDVLVYYPFYESLTVRGTSLLSHFGGAAPPARGTTFEKAAGTLQAAGFTYDFVSDRQLRRTRTENGRITTEGGTSYAGGRAARRLVTFLSKPCCRFWSSRAQVRRSCRWRAGRPMSAAWPISTPGARGSRPRSMP